jgi:hypothetical protein
MLAEGYTKAAVAKAQGLGERVLYTWQSAPEFSQEVDRLSVMVGIASRAGRLRIAHRLIRERVTEEKIDTDKDLLDWLKFAQSETDGVQSELASSLAELVASVAGDGGGSSEQTSPETEESR